VWVPLIAARCRDSGSMLLNPHLFVNVIICLVVCAVCMARSRDPSQSRKHPAGDLTKMRFNWYAWFARWLQKMWLKTNTPQIYLVATGTKCVWSGPACTGAPPSCCSSLLVRQRASSLEWHNVVWRETSFLSRAYSVTPLFSCL
jgi:hypothetical protein